MFEIFEGIRDTSILIREALLKNDWNAVGEILRDAHPQRQKLSPHITTPQMDMLIDKAMANGAIAPKVCGAGGGGCMAFFCEDGRRADVEKALADESGVEVLDWKLAQDGLVTKVASSF